MKPNELKLSEYIAALCNALEANNPEDKAVTMNLLAEHKAHREVASHGLKSLFLGGNRFLLDDLFQDRQICFGAYQNSLKQHAAWAYEKDAKKAVKPKRVIQSAPKKGKIPKEKIEKAMKEVRKQFQEKKAKKQLAQELSELAAKQSGSEY